MKMDLDWVKKEVYKSKQYSAITENDDAFKIAVILLSSAIVGTNIKKLSELTHYSSGYISKIGKYFREFKIWKNGKINFHNLFGIDREIALLWLNIVGR